MFQVLIVQASCYTKYLGNITVYFDASGNVIEWDGAPIFMDSNIEQGSFFFGIFVFVDSMFFNVKFISDKDILEKLKPWKEMVDAQGQREVAVARTPLMKSGCNNNECNIGNFLTAAGVHHYVDLAEEGHWTYASISLAAVGGIRTTLNSGRITYSDLITTMPFENTLDTIELKGKHIVEMLEYAVTTPADEPSFSARNMLQFTGN